jgi:hypothetical protein
MTFQAYLDNIKAKTGKTPEDFAKLAHEAGLTKHGEIVVWLKSEFELGHGHATAIAAVVLKAGEPKRSPDDELGKLFSGTKAIWREVGDKMIAQVRHFGPDVVVSVGATYASFLRGRNKFGIVQPSSAQYLDIGIKLKGVEPRGRFGAAGSWNSMVTHRVRVSEPRNSDAEVILWLKRAYDVAPLKKQTYRSD